LAGNWIIVRNSWLIRYTSQRKQKSIIDWKGMIVRDSFTYDAFADEWLELYDFKSIFEYIDNTERNEKLAGQRGSIR
jgi:hypothetical protein